MKVFFWLLLAYDHEFAVNLNFEKRTDLPMFKEIV